ncbi:IclR family transcriptional regulator [Ramlibacter monticola]|uniref:IclR family transcriptional regulator n=1 Tax=Ramlibacter monticola TaxID=1926872 RepID=A0A937CUJ6_9BURK|nr:IclR family transcriptional regulator [Ramlibacter monticola]MBL0392704.1 IclR family transcriptional regulator [Ramlibacter monticola]
MPRDSSAPAIEPASAPGGAAAVDRALTLLAAFRSGDTALSLAELAARTDLYKSTALRLLASLEHAGMVQKLEDGRYGLGAEVARLHGIYAASFSLDRVVLPVLKKLVQATGESAAYHVLQGQGPSLARLCLFRVDSPHPVRDHIRAGDVLPADRGTGGRVLMAFDAARQHDASTRDRRLYAQIRERGFHAAVGDRLAEVGGISAPVFRADGSLAGAVTLTMPAHRYDQRLAKAVLEAARSLSGKV